MFALVQLGVETSLDTAGTSACATVGENEVESWRRMNQRVQEIAETFRVRSDPRRRVDPGADEGSFAYLRSTVP